MPDPDTALQRIHDRLSAIYPDRETAGRARDGISRLIEKWSTEIPAKPLGWSERDAFLITYAGTIRDAARPSLRVLHEFLHERLGDAFSFVHVLPFYPSTSDHGFSVVDYRQVREDLGAWDDAEALTENYRVVFDCVLNHISQESAYVRGHLAKDKRYEGFCIERDPAMDTSNVTRPRQSPLFHSFKKPNGDAVDLWTTFSSDQVDLNYRNPAVLIELLDVLLFYAAKGAAMIRLDAIPYLWKTSGTSCIHLPETHEVIRLIRAVFDAVAPHVILLSETNVPHEENISYFGPPRLDEAHIIYNFSLAPLLLHTLDAQDAGALSKWASALDDFGDECTYLNVTATHDGIGVRPVEGILSSAERQRLADLAVEHGGYVNFKANPDGTATPYELNISWFDAINNPNAVPPAPAGASVSGDSPAPDTELARFLLSQAIPMALQGIPGIYIHSLLGSRNYLQDVDPNSPATYRSVNRRELALGDLAPELDAPDSLPARVFQEMTRLLRIRRDQPAFHPSVPQRILDLGPKIFAVHRPHPDAPVTTLFNVTAHPQTVSPDTLHRSSEDLISGEQLDANSPIPLAPWQFRWLTPS